jgi:hypothetical protein
VVWVGVPYPGLAGQVQPLRCRTMSPTASVAFATVSQDQNPNVTANDSTTAYFNAMGVTFASLRRWNPDLPLELISDAPAPAPFADVLSELGVQLRLVPFRHRPPEGFHHSFGASLYMLDALNETQADTAFLDPDVLCVRPLAAMWEATSGAMGVLPMDYTPSHNINGLTRLEAGELHRLLGEPVTAPPAHFGGECYVIPADLLAPLSERAEKAWAFALARHAVGLTRFTTEEHILSYAARGVPTCSVEPFIRRVWTAARWRTVTGHESDLTLWHLPAEKNRGFVSVYAAVLDRKSWFWTTEHAHFVDMAGRAMGLHHRSLGRFAKDSFGRVARHFM